jgi:hypothetical protein
MAVNLLSQVIAQVLLHADVAAQAESVEVAGVSLDSTPRQQLLTDGTIGALKKAFPTPFDAARKTVRLREEQRVELGHFLRALADRPGTPKGEQKMFRDAADAVEHPE